MPSGCEGCPNYGKTDVMDDDVLVASVDELVRNFRSALIAVIPAAERAKFIWSDVMYQHPAWEKLQGCLFNTFVVQPISVDRNRASGELPLAPYDIDQDAYALSSRIICETVAGNEITFVRFVTGEGQPFDTVQGVEVDPAVNKKGHHVEIPLTDVRFLFLRRMSDGTTVRVYNIEAFE